MSKTYLWQEAAFPHFYCNPAVVAPLETEFKEAVVGLDKRLRGQHPAFADVLTEEILANSEIEGVLLDRESVNSSFVQNIVPAKEKEQGAVRLTQMALTSYDEPLTHELLWEMHREIMKGTTEVPPESIGTYVGDMKVVSGRRLEQEFEVVHEGVPKDAVMERMAEFIDWYNACTKVSPLLNAIQGHVHFETLHPFCDGNGRIGRSLILMSLCRDLERSTPLALSRSFNKHLEDYYRQFRASLDLTETMAAMQPLFLQAVRETGQILELTAHRTLVSDQADAINERQRKVLHRLIDYELRGGFKGGMTNAKYQKMTGIAERTALRDLSELEAKKLMIRTGQLKGTRYYLNVPHLVKDL